MPAISPMRGEKPASVRASARLSRRYSPLARPKSARARGSSVYARTTAMPATYSWTRSDRTLSWFCAASVRSLTLRLKRRASRTRIGEGASDHSVSHGSTASMAASTPTKANVVETRLIAPKPRSDRTAVMSLVERAIRSPVECVA